MPSLWLDLSNLVHTALGTIALIGGSVALFAVKGSRLHIGGGWLFAGAMSVVVVTALLAMFHEFLPLAIVMCLAVLYLIPSAIWSIRRDDPRFMRWHGVLMSLTGGLAAFTLVQFVRINLGDGAFLLGPLVLAAMFGWLFVQDWQVFRAGATRATDLPANFWVRRHLARMVLAFTFAVMALVRIGINFGLSLEASVLLPLAVAAIVILAFYRRYPLRD